MDKSYYLDLIKKGEILENGNIKIAIPCSPTAIKSHNISLGNFIESSDYIILIKSNYVTEFQKIIAIVKLKGPELIPTAKRTIQELIELDPEELTVNELFTVGLENVMLVSHLTTIVGVGRVHKELLELELKFKKEVL